MVAAQPVSATVMMMQVNNGSLVLMVLCLFMSCLLEFCRKICQAERKFNTLEFTISYEGGLLPRKVSPVTDTGDRLQPPRHYLFRIASEFASVDIEITHPDVDNAQFHWEPRTWRRLDPQPHPSSENSRA